jgi:hypothetical protein
MKRRFLLIFVLVLLALPFVSAQSCYDFDGGFNLYLPGYVTFDNYAQSPDQRDETCNNNFYDEWICENGIATKWQGNCICDATTTKCALPCVDTDGGLNTAESGMVVVPLEQYGTLILSPLTHIVGNGGISVITGAIYNSNFPPDKGNGKSPFGIIIGTQLGVLSKSQMTSLGDWFNGFLPSFETSETVVYFFINPPTLNEKRAVENLHYLLSYLSSKSTKVDRFLPSGTEYEDGGVKLAAIQPGNFYLDFHLNTTDIFFEYYCGATERLNKNLKTEVGVEQLTCLSGNGTIYSDSQNLLWNTTCIKTLDNNKDECNGLGQNTAWGNFDNNIETIKDNCCGTLKQDQGLIFKELQSASNHVCTLDGTKYVWKNAFTNPGKIVSVTKEETTPADLFISTQVGFLDDYDMVANDKGEWLVCDFDGNLAQSDYKGENFNDKATRCDPNALPECISFSKTGDVYSEFMCRNDGNREEIVECAVSRADTNAINPTKAYIPGESIPNPFSKDYSEFKNTDKCPKEKEFCFILKNPGDKLELKKPPKISDWSQYTDLNFEISISKGDLNDLELVMVNTNNQFYTVNLNIHKTGSVEDSGTWHKIRIPLRPTSIPNFNQVPIQAFFIDSTDTDVGLVKVGNFHFTGGDSFTCTVQRDSAEILSGVWEKDLDLSTTEHACNSRFMKWTGTRCCGDDFVYNTNLYPGEFYVDEAGICFMSSPYKEKELKLISILDKNRQNPSERLLSNGTNLLSCNTQNNLYSWIHNIRETDNNGISLAPIGTPSTSPIYKLPIKEYTQCGVVIGEEFFCTPNGWNSSGYTLSNGVTYGAGERSQPSWTKNPNNIPPGTTNFACCAPNHCFDGNNCMIPPDPQPGDTTIDTCVNGEWQTGDLKYDWLRDESGFCAQASECYMENEASLKRLDPNQTASKCKPDGWYSKSVTFQGISKSSRDYDSARDLYCNNGVWNTRTSYVAEKLVTLEKIIPSYTFSMVCGPKENVLIKDDIGESFRDKFDGVFEFTNSFDDDYFNNLCVVKFKRGPLDKDRIIIGGSFNDFGLNTKLNNPVILEEALYEAFNIDNFDISDCSTSKNIYDFQRCDDTFDSSKISNAFDTNLRVNNFYWNNFTRSFIYIPEEKELLGVAQGLLAKKLSEIFLQPIIAFLTNLPSTVKVDPAQLVESTLYNSIYLSRAGSKEILAFQESKKDKDSLIKDFVSITYTGFSEDICSSVNKIDPQGRKISCTVDQNTVKIFTTTGPKTRNAVKAPEGFIDSASQGTRLKP